jgi:hypothetical protein
MTIPTEPLSETTHEAITILVREMGVSRTLRFLSQYRTGHGDYTAERHTFLEDTTLDDLFGQADALDEAYQKKKAGSTSY